ncbi:hypothetical protein FBU30_005199 [Linnemannia zychae]|nr:hypothetical protein FBU30_005199 [Linnemannia zychae]
MRTISPKRAIIAVAVLLAIIGTASMPSTDAAPVANTADIQSGDDYEPFVIAHLQKRQNTEPPTNTPSGGGGTRTTTSSRPPATPTSRPATTATQRPTTTEGAHTTTRASSHVSSSTSSGQVPVGTGTSTASAANPDASNANNDSNVPTGVSKNVFIGLGTVGGLIVFALGGVAFCRHRKKKNLATALLQQTAQFNNNNPYAKLPEPVSPKESLPMTPTKPLGTYNVVATYTPALADEIEIGLGDSVTILQEYDDGWCMGVNNSRGGIKGVFPRHCVEGMGPYEGSQHGVPGGPHYPPSPSFKATANKRMSSIAPGNGWNNGYQNGGNYPPQPSPQYPGPQSPNQGGGGGGYYNGGGGGY